MWLSTFLVFLLIVSESTASPDDSLPVYLRGMQWNRVQEYLKEDLRLSDSVVPTNYGIELSVNVRGHAGTPKSDFNGTVTIYLNVSKPVDKIELHSSGLIIKKARLLEHAIFTKAAGVSRTSYNSDRETIIVHLNRTIQPNEEFMLQIQYRGIAKVDEYGLYENWDPKLNKSLDSNGPFILASRNFPTGARYWFPCFDEPDKKATFELQIEHPSGLNVYSNAKVERTESISEGRTLSVFERTRTHSTYQVALSVNHYSREVIDVEGFSKVRLIISKNSHDDRTSHPDRMNRHRNDPNRPIIPALLKQNLELFKTIGVAHREKLDIIILEGAYTLNIQPGLITIGRYNFWRFLHKRLLSQDLKNLAQASIGNHISVRFPEYTWLNDVFTNSLSNDTYVEVELEFQGFHSFKMPDEILFSSLHERPLRESIIHRTSTKQYLASKDEVPRLKAAHLFRLLKRFCDFSSVDITRKYVHANEEQFADIDDFIGTLSQNCPDPEVARDFLKDYIDQPGKALLSVKRFNDSVTIHQTRYHSTYFDPKLRDTKQVLCSFPTFYDSVRTRYTIPIFFTINGTEDVKVFRKNETSLQISVSKNSLFLIDPQYDHLYFAYYEDIIVPLRKITDEERAVTRNALLKSMIAAISVGFVKYNEIVDQISEYIKRGIFKDYELYLVESETQEFKSGCNISHEYLDDDRFYKFNNDNCAYWGGHPTTWDGLFNNDTKYWEDVTYSPDVFVQHMDCMSQWNNSVEYRSFLEDNFLGENTVIRSEQMANLAQRAKGYEHWIDLHRFFFRNAANYTNHRFDLLADTVLNQRRVEPFLPGLYPALNIRQDYLKELHDFVLRNPQRAASISTEIEMRLEREYVREELANWHKRL